MKKTLILIGILLMVFSLVIAQAEQPGYTTERCSVSALAESGRARAMFDNVAVQEKIIAMKAVIKKAKEFNADANELEGLQSDLEGANDELDDLAGEPGYNAKVQEIKNIIRQFKERSHAMAELEGNEAEVLDEIENDLNNAEPDINADRNRARVQARETLLGVFDLHVCLAKEKMDRLSARNIDVNAMIENIQAMEALREEYQLALEVWDRNAMKGVNARIRTRWKQIRRNNWRAQAAKVVNSAETARTRLQATITTLQENGADTAQIEAALQRMDEKVQRATEKLETAETDEDAEEAEDLLDDAQGEVNSARETAIGKARAVGRPEVIRRSGR